MPRTYQVHAIVKKAAKTQAVRKQAYGSIHHAVANGQEVLLQVLWWPDVIALSLLWFALFRLW